jgi:hypothetical protein
VVLYDSHSHLPPRPFAQRAIWAGCTNAESLFRTVVAEFWRPDCAQRFMRGNPGVGRVCRSETQQQWETVAGTGDGLDSKVTCCPSVTLQRSNGRLSRRACCSPVRSDQECSKRFLAHSVATTATEPAIGGEPRLNSRAPLHSITSSAAASRVAGTSRPSVLGSLEVDEKFELARPARPAGRQGLAPLRFDRHKDSPL